MSLKERLQSQLRERMATQGRSTVPVEKYDWAEESSKARDIGEATTKALTEKRFPCGQCGAALNYAVGTRSLECPYCGHLNAINTKTERLRELDFHAALRQLQNSPQVDPSSNIISCPNCAAQFALDAHIHSGDCPFCGTAVVTETSQSKPLKPKGLLPFEITADTARNAYTSWLKKSWFAPNALKKYARSDAKLNGVYVPYWTYDSDTATSYHGQRGEIYYVTKRYTTTVKGRRVTRTRKVPKTRWYSANGRTSRHFDDVLVGATRTLPRQITDWLAPWDLENLIPYTEDYLAGFSSEVYQVDLDEGFNIAQETMDKVIRSDVRRAIGGDRQRITSLKTHHSDTTFKHVLLPLWTAGFQFRGKTYRFVVNGRTGKVRGERPYSVIKIALASIAGIVLAGTVLVVFSEAQGMGSAGSSGYTTGSRGSVTTNWSRRAAPSRWPETPLNERLRQIEELVPRVQF